MRKDGVKPKHAIFRKSSQPPKGMHINHDDLVGLATGPPGQGEAVLKSHDREIVSFKRNVQNNKQMLSSLRRRARDRQVEPYRVPESANRINARWTNEELLLAVQGKLKVDSASSQPTSLMFQESENLEKTLLLSLPFWGQKLNLTFEPSSSTTSGDTTWTTCSGNMWRSSALLLPRRERTTNLKTM